MKPYRATRPFRSKSRPDLGTVEAGRVVALDPAHAAQINAGLVEPVAAPRKGRHAVEPKGGGWFAVTLDGEEVEAVKGRQAAEQRAAELDAEAHTPGRDDA